VLFLDEPSVGLDVTAREVLWTNIRNLLASGCSIVLTTHYLEEAQAMCKRVAMLKLGKVVALDTMSQLIRRISGSQLVLHLPHNSLPEELQPLLNHPPEDNKYSLRINDYAEVEGILARLRQGGISIDEMQLQQADLEDIFLQIMDENIV
jgi:ABC-2 type transport system ATP-binding protein